jgi:tetratricopeptide (TPR) repeat protein
MPTATQKEVQIPSAAEEYARLLLRLHELALAGEDEGSEADAIRDEMTSYWYRMSATEQDRLTGLSADLAALEDGPAQGAATPRDNLERYRERARQAYESGDPDLQLSFLRESRPDGIPADAVPFMQSRVWERLGLTDLATFFMKEAERRNPVHAMFVMMLLEKAGRQQEAEGYAKRFLASGDPTPAEVYFAAGTLFNRIRWLSGDEAKRESEPLIQPLWTALMALRNRAAAHTPDDRWIEVGLALSLGLCLERVGRSAEAIAVYSQQLGRQPDRSDTAMLLTMRGVAKYYANDPGAVQDFRRAVNEGAAAVWPYYFLTIHDLRGGRTMEALRVANKAVEELAMPRTVRAEMYGWVAIMYAILGQPTTVVRYNFDEAQRLDPTNATIKENREKYERSVARKAWAASDFRSPSPSDVMAAARKLMTASDIVVEGNRLAEVTVGHLLAA